jgi:sulfate adenylyltransferase large subunit
MSAVIETRTSLHQLLRFATIGSVDDGKSTLIGRLLHDAKGLFEDQIDAVARTTARRGGAGLDLSLVTDGLRAEREQGITIDVAYRYFATPKRSFIIADNPGHAQYTRNMATGASTADLAVALVDVRAGLLEQTRRHLAVAATLGIEHVVLAVNKMDLVEWSEDAFDDAVGDAMAALDRLGVSDVTAIPISALDGGNVVERADGVPWYEGPTLLEHLETVQVDTIDAGRTASRLPIQLVLRQSDDGRPVRRYAGTLAGAPLSVGDHVVVLPSATRTTVTAIEHAGRAVEHAPAGLAVTVQLAHDVDAGRGDVIADATEPATTTRLLDASICWFGSRQLAVGDRVLVKHATRTERAVVRAVHGRLDLDTLATTTAEHVALNDIAEVRLALAGPLVVDCYTHNRATGGFLLIDEGSNATVGAGMVRDPNPEG